MQKEIFFFIRNIFYLSCIFFLFFIINSVFASTKVNNNFDNCEESLVKQVNLKYHELSKNKYKEIDKRICTGKKKYPSPQKVDGGDAPLFPFPFGKTKLDISKNPRYMPNERDLRYATYQHFYSIFDVKVKTPLLTVHHLGPLDKKVFYEKFDYVYKFRKINDSVMLKNVYRKRKRIGKVIKSMKRPKKFKSDSRFIVWERVGHKDYRERTRKFSRGHLTPNGDFKKADLKVGTFITSNIAPQYQRSFNDGIWNNLEICVREWANAAKSHGLTVISGVVHEDPRFADKTRGGIQIPTHFYKIIIDEGCLPPVRIITFLMENKKYHRKEVKNISKYITTIDDIEEKTGIKFLISLPDEIRDSIVKIKSKMWKCSKAK